MQLTKVLHHQQTRSMCVATRHGDTITVYGSKGDTYQLMPFINKTTGELQFACSCPNYVFVKAQKGEECKHAEIAHENYSKRVE